MAMSIIAYDWMLAYITSVYILGNIMGDDKNWRDACVVAVTLYDDIVI